MTEYITKVNSGDDVDQTLLNGQKSDVQTKLGPVAKFDNDLEQTVDSDEAVNYKKPKDNNQFIGLTKEELKAYINDPKWKRIRWIIAILYILILILLLIGAILLVVYSQRCPPKPKLVWYEKDIIYEIDVTTFRDSDQDGIGDIKGVQQKLDYLEKNNIKSILLRSSIFNITNDRSLRLNGDRPAYNKYDLLTIDSRVGSQAELLNLAKILNRKDMHVIVDLPLSSTLDPNGNNWYGSSQPLSTRINNPCSDSQSGLGCQYYTSYGELPLNFKDPTVYNQSESRIRYWLGTKNLDGIRVNLPLEYNPSTRSYSISLLTLDKWGKAINEIQKKTKPKLFLIDIPFGLQHLISSDYLHNRTAHPLLLNTQQQINVDSRYLYRRIESFKNNNFSRPLFWQLGSQRRSDQIGTIDNNKFSKEMALTMAMLMGGTPIMLYGEEIGLDQRINPLMSWTPDESYGGFSSCSLSDCQRTLSDYRVDSTRTSVKRQEALGGGSKESLLNLYRRLSKLRNQESFQFGLLESGYDETSNLYWFLREAPGHRGYVVVFNLNKNPDDIAHISLYELTKHDVPYHIHYEYQWPKITFPTSNKTHINSDNILINPESINIFWWSPKLLKPNILFKKAKEHSNLD